MIVLDILAIVGGLISLGVSLFVIFAASKDRKHQKELREHYHIK